LDRRTGVELFHCRRISKNNLLCAFNVLVQGDCSRVIMLCYLEVGQPAYSCWRDWNCTVRNSATNADCWQSGMAPKFFVDYIYFIWGGVVLVGWRMFWSCHQGIPGNFTFYFFISKMKLFL